MNNLETQERATLLLKVQRALDAAGVGRESLSHGVDPGISLDEDSHLHIFPGSVNVYVSDPFENNFGTVATFTFAELFPELEWDNAQYKDCADIEGFVFEIPHHPTEVIMSIWDEERDQAIELNFRTPERAKRAAQSIADLLAEAGREL